MSWEEDQREGRRAAWTTALVLLYGACLGVGLFKIMSGPSSHPHKRAASSHCVAIVPIYGAISVGQDGPFSSNSADRLTKRLKALSENDSVKAVVLRINSPGGSVGAVQEIYDEITRLKVSGKKVVASMGDVAASGGYYIAANADKIYANPGTLTGSIGVIFQLSDVQNLFKKIGVKIEPVKSAAHKDIGSPFRTQTAEEIKILQSIIDDAYGQFVQAIVLGRKMDKAKVMVLADGRIYSGAQAKSNGLVDELGNLEAAVTKAGEMAGIPGKPRVIYDEEPWKRFFSSLSQSSNKNFLGLPVGKSGMRLAYLSEYDW